MCLRLVGKLIKPLPKSEFKIWQDEKGINGYNDKV